MHASTISTALNARRYSGGDGLYVATAAATCSVRLEEEYSDQLVKTQRHISCAVRSPHDLRGMEGKRALDIKHVAQMERNLSLHNHVHNLILDTPFTIK